MIEYFDMSAEKTVAYLLGKELTTEEYSDLYNGHIFLGMIPVTELSNTRRTTSDRLNSEINYLEDRSE